ncbi:filamentous hemagglutinin N-terminal domain-containing protein [Burkholderia cenocepacia]|uniref:two-partner secretion domain-containing protein n=1 Tax=Burkholderia cenocepacia TaxID=95486 RepID=UPI001B94061B|nr:GLUG motif-containing protein [Burkholderia cenocepacia]MBR8041911.1 filamentous hemagglutinin N-terminal domain-containing protein [Burkholderia cenocepacia]MBR8324321.1 filamentous hemagglutinin N-terminal domain-containing protein [Burkholderia cenocepacia]
MNKTYALVWNQAQGCWCAVGETARRHGKSAGGKRLAAAVVSLLGLTALPAFALPTGEAITAGQADILRDVDGKSMSINQHSDKLVTNWQSFDVAGGERVAFHQPGSQSIALNRVIGNNGSQIHGSIDANGKVFLVNPNGVLFGSGAQVNVGGLVASTQAISDADFLAGNYRFAGTSAASIVNAGKITAADGGSVALLGARVSNNGVIQAKMGRVALGAGNTFKVNFDGSDLLSLQVEGGAVDAQAHNGGLLKADGGEVLMTARAAGDLLNAVVNNTGTIEAKGLASRGGRITLDGDTVNVGGKLDASAAVAGAQAGSVVTRGQRVNVAAATNVDTRAGNAAGTWTIEAANAGVNGTAGGDRSITSDTLSRNLGTTNVALTSTRGDLSVDGPVAWSSDNALTLSAQQGNVDLQRAVSATGAYAKLAINAADKIRINDAVKLTGRNAHLELNAKNGHALTNDKAVVTLSGNNATFRSNGNDYTVLHTVDDLHRVDNNLTGRYVVGNAIDGRGASFQSIGGDKSFAGLFDGLGNTISRLNVTNAGHDAVGLFAINQGAISNLGLSNITATAATQPKGSHVSVGALAGHNFGTISNVTAKDVAVTGKTGTIVGGLVGSNYGGTIEHTSVSGRVAAEAGALAVGGLVGQNQSKQGWVNDQPIQISGTIRDSHANVQVTTASSGQTGGLVGDNRGRIETSSSAGSVVATTDRALVGGLVGINHGVIDDSSSTATVTARVLAVAGGLVGYNIGTLSATRASGKVVVGEASFAGGLVGGNEGDIIASTANGDVVAALNGTVGGLAGSSYGRIRASYAHGNVTTGNTGTAGGLVGFHAGDVSGSHATGNVVVGANGWAGGFVGRNDKDSAIHGSTARGNVTAAGKSTLGGFAGVNDGFIETSAAHGKVTAAGDSVAGGFAGENTKRIDASDAFGDVIAGNASSAGGFAGVNTGDIDSSNASGNVTVGSDSTAGGFAGTSSGALRNATAIGNVLAGLNSSAGGLVGRHSGKIVNGEASGTVKAGNYSFAGGLVGQNKSGDIDGSIASGNVEAGAGSRVGGLVGELVGSVKQSRATGSVKGGNGGFVGGLIGSNGGTVATSSSSGTVSGGRYAILGGLAGGNFGWISGSSTTSRVETVAGYEQSSGPLVGVNYGSVRP